MYGLKRVTAIQLSVAALFLLASMAFPPGELRLGALQVPPQLTTPLDGRWVGGREIFKALGEVNQKRRIRFLRNLSKRLKRSSTLQALQDRSLLAVLDGDPQQAVVLLEREVQKNPKNTALLANLSLAYLARAKVRQAPSDLVRALATVEAALAQDSECEEALFNKALILERLSLRFQAKFVWNSYISNPHHQWQDLARQHFMRYQIPTVEEQWEIQKRHIEEALSQGDRDRIEYAVSHFPQSARVFVQEELLPRWAKARVASDSIGAKKLLLLARDMGRSIARFNGERSAIDAVAEIDLAEQQGLGRNVALAYIDYRAALDSFDKGRAEEAIGPLLRAREAFLSTGSQAGVLWTTFWCARAEYLLGNVESAWVRIGEILENAETFRYPALRGRALWAKGLFSMLASRFGLALSYYRKSLEDFTALHEAENTGAVEALVAEDLSLLGREREAWGYRLQALEKLSSYSSSIRLHNVLVEAADKLLTENKTTVAAYIQAEDQEVMRRVGTGSARAENLLLRCRISSQQGDIKGAYRYISEAQKEIDHINNIVRRERLRADTELAEGDFNELVPAPRILDSLSRAISYYDEKGLLPLEAFGRLLSSRTYLLLNEEEKAQKELENAIALKRRGLSTAEGLQKQMALQGPWQTVLEDILELRSGRDEDLVDVFSLLEKVRGRNGSPRPWHNVSAQSIDPEALIVSYALLRNHMLAWIISKDRSYFVRVEVNRGQFEKNLDTFVSSLVRRDNVDSVRAPAQALFAQLVEPVSRVVVSKKSRWIIVADGILGRVPFEALMDSRTKRYLIEDADVQYAPSVVDALSVAQLQSKARLDRSAWRLVAVGEPQIDSATYPELQSLPEAANEAREIASLYPKHELLTGQEATPGAFLKALAKGNIIHFAGHAAVHPLDPGLSRLFLAPEQGKEVESVIYASDLQKLDLHQKHLFVLSACDTVSSGVGAGSGIEGFARAVLGTGIPQVLASRWLVADEASREILVVFHRSLMSGVDPARALRIGQLTLARKEGVPPGSWAAFSLFSQDRVRQ